MPTPASKNANPSPNPTQLAPLQPTQLAPPQPARPAASRSSSTLSIKSAVGHFSEDARPSISNRNSQSELPAPAHHLDVPANTSRQPSRDNLRSPPSDPITAANGPADTLIPGTALTTLLAGRTGKSFTVHTELLVTRSPYFATLLSTTPPSSSPTLAFPDLDEFAFALWVRWLYGAAPRGPDDYHSMQHYLALHLLAATFRCERLQNDVMDLIRGYYRAHAMTAPAGRLEYVYERSASATTGEGATTTAGGAGAETRPRVPQLRRFLVYTAASRYLGERGEPRLSEAMRGVVAKGGELAVDFAEALAVLHRSEVVDVRGGPDCAFHEHVETGVCRARVGGGGEGYE